MQDSIKHASVLDTVNGLAKSLQCDRLRIQSPLACFGVSLVGLAGLAGLVQRGLELGPLFIVKALVALALGGSLMLVVARPYFSSRVFGAANQVTLARGALTALLFALLGEQLTPDVAWFAITIAVIALALDGLDGRLARRHGSASRFGARFDMETDALLILILSLLVWLLGKAGPWILFAGLARYLFVAATWLVSWMRSPLPESSRRQTVCVLQVLSLVVCLVPWLAPPASTSVALAGVLVLANSFAIDVWWLAQQRRSSDRKI